VVSFLHCNKYNFDYFLANKQILKNVSGNFRSGELTAILGTSGAGKSSLLNILAGFMSKNIHGQITINDMIRDEKLFRQQSAFITQSHDLQPLLTVYEALKYSANLKIGNDVSILLKKIRVIL
jgi:ATP-binding cassette subfamily G (WHITE) protein 1